MRRVEGLRGHFFVALLLCGCPSGSSSIGEPLLEDAGTASDDGAPDDSGTTPDSATGSTVPGGSDGDSGGPSGSSGDSGGGSTGAAPAQCPSYSTCTAPIDCSQPGECGQTDSLFDAQGCARPRCATNDECPDGQSCFVFPEWGACQGTGLCSDNASGVCECAFVGLICDVEGICAPNESVPPPGLSADDFCNQFTDEDSCSALGPFELNGAANLGCRWFDGYEVAADESCEMSQSAPRCLYTYGAEFDNGACDNDPGVRPYYLETDETVHVLLIDDGTDAFYTDAAPWIPCDENPDAPAACDCACP